MYIRITSLRTLRYIGTAHQTITLSTFADRLQIVSLLLIIIIGSVPFLRNTCNNVIDDKLSHGGDNVILKLGWSNDKRNGCTQKKF
jgi:hypothetical protein